MKKITFISIILFCIFNYIYSQSHNSTQAHQAQVTNIEPVKGLYGDEEVFFSTGEDGFLIRWTDDNRGEHYQISDVGIKLMSVSPTGNEVAIYETDGGSVNKVSVWDWRNLTRKYQKNFSDSITSLTFSAKGNYLIIGTATVDGAVFVRTAGWQIVDKIHANTSIVNYIQTTDTEKTVAFYSPAGTLSYFNLSTGQLKEKITTIQGLTSPVMFNNYIFLAGIKDNNIYILNAFKGNTITSIPAQNPIILSTSSDTNFYYLEYDGRNNYELKMLEVMDNLTVSNPRLVKTFRGPRGDSAICMGTKFLGDLYLGSQNGEIYKADIEPTITTQNLSAFTENTYSKIYAMAEAPEDFYFLTSNAIYKSSYDTGVINKLCATEGQTQIITYDDSNVILWSKSSRQNIILKNLIENTEEVLFSPKNTLQTVRLCIINDKKYLIEIESNSTVNLYDFETKELKEVYSGTGIQDAILTNNGNLYVAKSAATNPKVPMLCVNLDTLETVPLNVRGNVAYALSTDGTTIYGINLISDETGRSTYVFSYNTNTKQVINILKFAEEDSEAFTYLNGSNLYTNIGKNKVYCYNLISKKRFSYNRSASIPSSICKKNNRVVILNNNGSISWCGPNSPALLVDWYFTKDEQWYEF